MTKKAVIVIVENSEEIEVVVPADLLRRAGVDVTIAGVSGKNAVSCSRNVVITPDMSLQEAVDKGPYDAVILPGGLIGSETLLMRPDVGELLKDHAKRGAVIATICAASLALKSNGLFYGKKLTSYPEVKERLEEGGHYTYVDERVAIDGNLITSRAPGTAFEFTMAILEKLVGKEAAAQVSTRILLK